MEPVMIFTALHEEGETVSEAFPMQMPTGNNLSFLQTQIGGLVDCVRGETPAGRVDVWCADELPENAPLNVFATIIAQRPIRGTVVITDCDDEGNTIGLNAGVMDALVDLCEFVQEVLSGDPNNTQAAITAAVHATEIVSGFEALLAGGEA